LAETRHFPAAARSVIPPSQSSRTRRRSSIPFHFARRGVIQVCKQIGKAGKHSMTFRLSFIKKTPEMFISKNQYCTRLFKKR
jgi:hypothetical protein